MKKLISILLLFIVINSQAQFRTYRASAETNVNNINYSTNLRLIKIRWKNNNASNINNMLTLRVANNEFKVLDDFEFDSKIDDMITQKVHIIGTNNKIHTLYFSRNINLSDSKFTFLLIEPNVNLIIYSDFKNCTFN